MKTTTKLIAAIIALSLYACGGSSEKSTASNEPNKKESPTNTNVEKSSSPAASSNSEDDMKLKQYIVAGKEIYKTYCLACHQSEGQGLAKLYPPLAKSDYLIANPDKAACGVRYGQFDPITVNGVKYNQIMPGIATLSDLEIAEVVTYISNSWGNEAGLISVKDVSKWLEACKQ